MKRFFAVLLCLLALALSAIAQPPKPPSKASAPAPDKAYLQNILNAWSTLDPAKVAHYYASGPHTFYDVAPLKYTSWEEYANGVKNLATVYKSAKFTLNDDVDIHSDKDVVWATATLHSEMTKTDGKIEMATARWTVIFENRDGKWVIVHDHFSEPLQ